MPPRVGRGGAGDAGVVDDVGIAQMRALIEVRLTSPVYPSLARGAPSLRPTRPPDARVGTPVALRRPTSATATRSARPFARSTTRGRPSTTVSATSSPRRSAPFARFTSNSSRASATSSVARDAPAPVTPDLLARRWAQRVALARGELAVAAYLNDAANAREAVETRAHLHRVDRDNAARLADDHRRRVDETVALSSAMANVESKLLRWRANVAEGLRVAARTAAPRARIRVRTRTDAGRDPKTTTSKASSKTANARNGEPSRRGRRRLHARETGVGDERDDRTSPRRETRGDGGVRNHRRAVERRRRAIDTRDARFSRGGARKRSRLGAGRWIGRPILAALATNRLWNRLWISSRRTA